MRLTDLLALSHVPRWSIVPRVKEQSVADHAYRVAIIAYELARRMNFRFSFDSLWYCLIHDAAESRSGDIPSLFKKKLPATDVDMAEVASCPWTGAECEPGNRPLIKLADLIEAYTWIDRWGVGEHARQVVKESRRQVWLFVEKNRYDPQVVGGVLVDILTDRGRADWLTGEGSTGLADSTPAVTEPSPATATATRTPVPAPPSREGCAGPSPHSPLRIT